MTMTPTPVAWSETPPSEDGPFHLSRLHQSGHSEPLIGQKTGNWWLILGWNCDEYHSEDLVQMGITFGPRITLTPAPPALEWVGIEEARKWPEGTRLIVEGYDKEGKFIFGEYDAYFRPDWLTERYEKKMQLFGCRYQFLRLDGGQA